MHLVGAAEEGDAAHHAQVLADDEQCNWYAADGLARQLHTTSGFDQVLASWRHESISATLGFSKSVHSGQPGLTTSRSSLSGRAAF
jgi:hypothetical protein